MHFVKNYKLFGAFFAAFVIGFVLAYRLYPALQAKQPPPYRPPLIQLRANDHAQPKYSFINPLLTCETRATSPRSQLSRILKPRLEKLINEAKRAQQTDQISVYFDLRDGQWMGLNTDEKYYPASMLKVPLMMAYFKMAEKDPGILEERLVFSAAPQNSEQQYFPPAERLAAGKAYTVQELISRMIRYSDNQALDMLLARLPNLSPLMTVFTDLGLPLPGTDLQPAMDFMSVKLYAYFFRVLYNATYLNQEFSQEAMQLLSATSFKEGITAPLPEGIAVAHKFGERTLPLSSATNQGAFQELHDCGIVYNPQQPYLLCVMTKGTNPEVLAQQIQAISKTVYDFIQNDWQAQ